MWLAQLALHFGADLVAAQLVINGKGYDRAQMPTVWDLALFYTARPRLAWIILGFLGSFKNWSSATKQTMITETVMQLLGCYYLGRTADFGSKNGLYVHHHYPRGPQVMYGGALFTLIMTAGSIFGLLAALGATLQEKKGMSCSRVCSLLLMSFFGLLAFVGRLLFLTGYVKVAQDLYVNWSRHSVK